MTKQKTIIIGAGIGGLATANILARAGYDVSVYDKNARPGGKTDSYEYEGFRFDAGASWYLMPEVFDQYFSLFSDVPSRPLDLIKLTPAYKVFFEKYDPVTISGVLENDAVVFERIEPGAGNALRNYVTQSDRIYRLSLKHFLYTNFESLTDLIKYDIILNGPRMARLGFMPIHRYVSSYVSDLRLQQILEYPMVFLGTSPFSAPAIYSLMSALDFKEGVYYPKGGMYTIIEKIVDIGKALDVTYQYGTAVTKIITQNGQARGVQLADGSVDEADIVISNADLHFTETVLLDPKDQTYPQEYWSKKEAGPSALLLYLGVKGSLPTLQHHNLFFVDDWKKNFDAIYSKKSIPTPASIYVCKPSASDATVAPVGHENVFVLVPLPPGLELNSSESGALADQYIAQIADMAGITDFAERIVGRHIFGPNDFANKYNAWQSTALGPSHVLKQSALFRTPNVSRKVKNLFYVGGSTTPGIGLPMCLISAQLVYKRLIGDKRGGPINAIRSTESVDL